LQRRPSWPRRWRESGRAHAVFVAPGRVWHAAEGQASAASCEDFVTWCRAHRGSAARVLLSGHLTHSIAVDAELPIATTEETTSYSRTQFVHYYGPPAQQWPLAVWCDNAQRGAAALHGIDLLRLQSDAGEHDVRLLGVSPWWSVALRVATRTIPAWPPYQGRAAFLLIEEHLATWLLLEHGVLCSMRQRRVAAPSASALENLLADWQAADEVDPGFVVVGGFGVQLEAQSVRLGGARVAGLLDSPQPGVDWMFE
jgi:hypothetical protein